MAEPQRRLVTGAGGVVIAVTLMVLGATISTYATFAASVPDGSAPDAPAALPASQTEGLDDPLPAGPVRETVVSDDDGDLAIPLPASIALPDVDVAERGSDRIDAGEGPPPSAAAAPPAAAVDGQVRLQIPRFNVNAPVTRMGIDGGGQMEIPGTASVVAWYGFTAAPGQPGNAVFAAHVNYAGQAGAFFDLHRLSVGDEVAVMVDGELLRYRVTDAYLVRPEDADMAAIIGKRSGPETITLITCGGEFDPNIRAYERRVIVQAERL